MNNAVWAMLNESEKALLREVEADDLAARDEDELLELHGRLRRVRTKYSKLYRRRAAAQVEANATRAKAHPAHERTAVKAEAFEEALGKVSQLVARAAKASAAELKAERLAAARAVKAGGNPAAAAKTGSVKGAAKATPAKKPTTAEVKRRTPVSKRAAASSRATTRRAQAKRDSR